MGFLVGLLESISIPCELDFSSVELEERTKGHAMGDKGLKELMPKGLCELLMDFKAPMIVLSRPLE